MDPDPYYYRHEHDGSGWSVCGPDGFILKKTDGPLDKNIAYIIAKLLSNQLSDALALLRDLSALGDDPAETAYRAGVTLGNAILQERHGKKPGKS